jgi:hypothetical protein
MPLNLGIFSKVSEKVAIKGAPNADEGCMSISELCSRRLHLRLHFVPPERLMEVEYYTSAFAASPKAVTPQRTIRVYVHLQHRV